MNRLDHRWTGLTEKGGVSQRGVAVAGSLDSYLSQAQLIQLSHQRDISRTRLKYCCWSENVTQSNVSLRVFFLVQATGPEFLFTLKICFGLLAYTRSLPWPSVLLLDKKLMRCLLAYRTCMILASPLILQGKMAQRGGAIAWFAWFGSA